MIAITHYADIILLALALGNGSFLLSFAIKSHFEGEKKALKNLIRLFILTTFPLVSLSILDFPGQNILSLSISILIIFTGVLFLLPIKGKKPEDYPFAGQIDERDIMFSRAALVPGSERFEEYYHRHPENRESDDRFRKSPGLLSPKSREFNPLLFAGTDALSATCRSLRALVDGTPAPEKASLKPEEISGFIKEWLYINGAHSAGITHLKKEHFYSVAGRKENYGNPVTSSHHFAIAFTVEMNHTAVRQGPKAPAFMESTRQYLNAGILAAQVAVLLRNLGYSARAHIDGAYQVVCPLVAKDAGLGEIGRMGLLMTPKLGSRVRIAVVTTELELLPDKTEFDSSMISFCESCHKCARLCPGQAIPYENRTEINGTIRWQINSEKCYAYWCKSGTDCGRCIAVCPYSHPSGFPHSLIRYMIKHNALFRAISERVDDLIYGKKPKPLPLLPWQKVSVSKKIQ